MGFTICGKQGHANLYRELSVQVTHFNDNSGVIGPYIHFNEYSVLRVCHVSSYLSSNQISIDWKADNMEIIVLEAKIKFYNIMG